MAELLSQVLGVLAILAIATGVRMVSVRLDTLSYPVVLVAVGVVVPFLGFDPGFRLSSELIMMILLPTILFQGAEETKTEHFPRTFPLAVVLTIIGVPIGVLILGWVTSTVLSLPLAIGLLYATIIYPVDPVAVIAVLRESEAPEWLAVLAETESHLSDGIAIVLFLQLLALLSLQLETAEELTGILRTSDLLALVGDVAVVGVGGVLVGGVAGAIAYLILKIAIDRMSELLVMILLPYTSYIVAHEFLHVSGVLAIVTAGLIIGHVGKKSAIDPDNVRFVERFWETSGFLVYTLLFVMIGVQVPFRRVIQHADLVLVAGTLLFLVRAGIVYGLLGTTNRMGGEPIPVSHQHVLVWGAIHTVIPVALLLTVPQNFPYREELSAMVFGVAILNILIQGLLMPVVFRFAGVGAGTPESADGQL